MTRRSKCFQGDVLVHIVVLRVLKDEMTQVPCAGCPNHRNKKVNTCMLHFNKFCSIRHKKRESVAWRHHFNFVTLKKVTGEGNYIQFGILILKEATFMNTGKSYSITQQKVKLY